MSGRMENSRYSLERAPGEWVCAYVLLDGVRVGWYWEDKLSNGFAAFKYDRDKPIARLKSERGCISKITGGKWRGPDQM